MVITVLLFWGLIIIVIALDISVIVVRYKIKYISDVNSLVSE